MPNQPMKRACLAINGRSLRRFCCPEWDHVIARLFSQGETVLWIHHPDDSDPDSIVADLQKRFPATRLSEIMTGGDSPYKYPAALAFGLPLDGNMFPKTAARKVLALRHRELSAAVIAAALACGVTHFLSDTLPDESGLDFADPPITEWLNRFIFLPPCIPSPPPTPEARATGFAIVCDDPRRDCASQRGRIDIYGEIAEALQVPTLGTAALARLSDAELGLKLTQYKSLFVATENAQLAHRLVLIGLLVGIRILRSTQDILSPLRTTDLACVGECAVEHEIGGPTRRACHAILNALRHPLTMTPPPSTEFSPTVRDRNVGDLAAHLIEAITRDPASAPLNPELAPWTANPSWVQWSRGHRAATPIALASHPLTQWMSHSGVPALMDGFISDHRSEGASRLWFEYFVATRRSAPGADLLHFVRTPGWADLSDRTFMTLRQREPHVMDLRGPFAAALAQLWIGDPQTGDQVGIPDRVVAWLEADAHERLQSPPFVLQRARAYARWRTLSAAVALVQRPMAQPTDFAQVAVAKLESLNEAYYLDEMRPLLRPILSELRTILSYGQSPGLFHSEIEKLARFIGIFLGEFATIIDEFERTPQKLLWSPVNLAEFAIQFLFCGYIKEAQVVVGMLWPRRAELHTARDLAFAEDTFALANMTDHANELRLQLQHIAPRFWDCADAASLRLRSLALVARGEPAAARTAFGRAVNLHPAFRLSQHAMEVIASRLVGGSLFVFDSDPTKGERHGFAPSNPH